MNKIIEQHGVIDFLINNAVEFSIKSSQELSLTEWQYAHDTNATAPFVLNKLVLPHMINNKFGVIANLIAVEGMAYSSGMSSSKASFRSLTVSSASEIFDNDDISIIGFAPGLVDTPLVFEKFTEYCEILGYDFSDYVLNITNNPGYEGLIPASHSAAALIHFISKGRENHGLICTPYLPLSKAKIIDLENEDIISNIGEINNITQANQYITEIDKYQKVIEHKIEIRTKELEDEKTKTAGLLENLRDNSKALQALNVEKTTLLKEVHHRVKNNMQIISSLLNLQANSVNDNLLRNLLEQSQSRITAIATVHNMLYNSTDFSRVNYGVYLTELCHYLLISFEHKNGDINIKTDSQEVQLSLNTSITLGLIINEILTNSLKHGFPKNRKGNIYIKFDTPKENGLQTLYIGDDGIGLTSKNDDGLGMSLIYDLTKQINGEVSPGHVKKPGTHYMIQFNEQEKVISQ